MLMNCNQAKENLEKKIIDGKNLTTSIIEGVVINPNTNPIVFLKKRQFPNDNYIIIDSAKVDKGGNFQFVLNPLEPNFYRITYKDKKEEFTENLLWKDGVKHVEIKIDTSSFSNEKYVYKIRKFKILGSYDNTILNSYSTISRNYYLDSIYPTNTVLNDTYESSDLDNKNRLDSLNEKLKYYKNESFKKKNKFLLDSMGTSMGILLTVGKWDETNFDFMDIVLAKFEREDPHSFILPLLKIKVKELKEKSIIGKNIKVFSLQDIDDNEVHLKDYLGQKNILLDFWASWCGPCVEKIPSYRKLQEEYSKDKLIIISISTDKYIDRWKTASKKYNINWINLIDNKERAMSKWYKISELPTNYLIDKNGQIIKKNISLVDLRAYLKD